MFATLIFAVLLAGSEAAAAPVPFGRFDAGDESWTRDTAFTPDGKTVYFTKSEPGYVGATIFVSHRSGDAWSAPEVAPFSGTYADLAPSVTPSGDAVVFASKRPPLGDGRRSGLYEAFLTGARAGKVVPLPNDVGSRGSENAPSVAADGTLFFALNSGGVRRIYHVDSVSERDSTATPVALSGEAPGVNDFDETVRRDGSLLVFASDRAGGLGASDLYLSVRRGGMWCPPEHLPAPFSSDGAEIAPSIAPDGHTLYFTSDRTTIGPPMLPRLDATAFRALLDRYDSGVLRLYAIDLGPVLAARANVASC